MTVLEANTFEERRHLKQLMEKEKKNPGEGSGARERRGAADGWKTAGSASFLGQAAHGFRDGDPESLSVSVLSPSSASVLSPSSASRPHPLTTPGPVLVSLSKSSHTALVPRGWQLRGTAPLPSNPHVFLSDDVKATSS